MVQLIKSCEDWASQHPARVVFPDAMDQRVIEAACRMSRHGWAKPVLLAFDQLAHARLVAGQPVLEADIPKSGIGPTTIDKHRARWDDSTLELLESREVKKAYGRKWFSKEKQLDAKLQGASMLTIDPRRVALETERDTAGDRWRTAREEMKAGNYVTPEHLTEAQKDILREFARATGTDVPVAQDNTAMPRKKRKSK